MSEARKSWRKVVNEQWLVVGAHVRDEFGEWIIAELPDDTDTYGYVQVDITDKYQSKRHIWLTDFLRDFVPVLLLGLLFLVACGGPSAPTAAQVSAALDAAGATNIHEEALATNIPVPHSYTSRQVFVLPSVAPKGGQVFICDTRRNCDAIYGYFDAFKALGGPYTYQSDSGLVVVQLNSGLTPSAAQQIAQAIKSF